MDYVTQTVSVKLDIPTDRRNDVLETFRQFNQACHMVLDVAWSGERKTYNKQDLHHATDYDVRDATDLPANLVCAARNRVADTVKACVARWSNGHATRTSKPVFGNYKSVVYDKRTVTIKDRYCTLATVNGRVKADYVLGDYQRQLLDDDDYEWRSATLSYRGGNFYLNITTRKPAAFVSVRTHIVMGVDLGVNNLAVTSTGRFFDAGFYNWKRNGFFRTKRSLQSKGTRGAKRVLARTKRRENRFADDYIHCVAKALVQEARDRNVDTIVFEQLDHIRDRMESVNHRTKRQMHTWAFDKLQQYVTYKAADVGIRVDFQDARYTSQKCSRCGHITRANRNGSRFHCRSCDYQLNADYNAAKNIGLNYIDKHCTEQQTPAQVAPCHSACQLALKSGPDSIKMELVTPKGEYLPIPLAGTHSRAAEATDKLPALVGRS